MRHPITEGARVRLQAVVDAGAHERGLQQTSQITVTVILATITMTFGAMIAVFVYRSLAPRFWGPLHIPVLLWVTTAILLVSSWTFEHGRILLTRGDQVGFHRWMGWTLLLAITFLLGQAAAGYLLLRGGLVLAKNPHSWFIFLFSGLHAIHILGGIFGIAYLLVRTRQPAGGPKYKSHTKVMARGVSICWHYLDLLWVVLFALLLIWKR